MVSTSGAYSLEMTVPGGKVACGGTTAVVVAPTHRRQGVLRQMMRAHLDDVKEHGEPIAALWASDSAHLRAVRVWVRLHLLRHRNRTRPRDTQPSRPAARAGSHDRSSPRRSRSSRPCTTVFAWRSRGSSPGVDSGGKTAPSGTANPPVTRRISGLPWSTVRMAQLVSPPSGRRRTGKRVTDRERSSSRISSQPLRRPGRGSGRWWPIRTSSPGSSPGSDHPGTRSSTCSPGRGEP